MKIITLPSCPNERREFKKTPAYAEFLEQKREAARLYYKGKMKEAAKQRRDESLKMLLDYYGDQIKEVPFAPDYYALKDGRVYSYFSADFMSQCATNDGYKYTALFFRYEEGEEKQNIRCLIHRIVAETFIGEIPEGFEVHHKNHCRDDNRLENLEIITVKENRLMRRPKAAGYKKPKVTEETKKKMSIAQKARYARSRKVAEAC